MQTTHSPSIWVRVCADLTEPGGDRPGAGLARNVYAGDLDDYTVDHPGEHGDRLQPAVRIRAVEVAGRGLSGGRGTW